MHALCHSSSIPSSFGASDSIGVFDSGFGGLTVLRQLFKIMPHEHFIFYGDTARLPYGEKSAQTVVRYSLENAALLEAERIKLLIVACSTASSVALDALKEKLQIPVVGMIGPGAQSALAATSKGRIAVLGTKGTIKSGAYQRAILERDPSVKVTAVACPLFVPLVEENLVGHLATRLMVREYLQSFKEQQIDTILLGCTHYPLLKELICEEVGEGVSVIDPAIACAAEALNILHHHRLNRFEEGGQANAQEHRYLVSDDPHKFQRLGELFLGRRMGRVELISQEGIQSELLQGRR